MSNNLEKITEDHTVKYGKLEDFIFEELSKIDNYYLFNIEVLNLAPNICSKTYNVTVRYTKLKDL